MWAVAIELSTYTMNITVPYISDRRRDMLYLDIATFLGEPVIDISYSRAVRLNENLIVLISNMRLESAL